MSTFQPVYVVLFWTCAALAVYAYAGYPLLIWGLSRWRGQMPRPPTVAEEKWPSVSLLIAAHNEEAVIEDRLGNALALDYPAGRMELVVGSDGSTDATATIVRDHASRGVRLLDYPNQGGKVAVLNASVPRLKGQIIVLSDANTRFEADAARRLVRWFDEEDVGVVVGRLVLVDPHTGRNADGLYWKYETFLKRCEAKLGVLLGANGAIYAIRRELFPPVPPGTLVDDLVIPLLAMMRSGCRIVYDPQAVAHEETAADVHAEFHRRCRIGAGGFQSLQWLWPLLNPRRGWMALAFFSHKLLRWLCPFFLLGMLLSSWLLRSRPGYRGALLAQLAALLLPVMVECIPFRLPLLKPLRLMAMFTAMNLALLVGFCRWLRGGQTGVWRRTARTAVASGRVQIP